MSPTVDFKWFADLLGTVLWVNFDHFEGLEFIGCGLVVKHNVGHRYNTNFFELLDSIEILFFEAVFGANSSFLVELPKVKEVVDAVTNVIFVGGLKSRWHPNVADAQVCQMLGIFSQIVPVLTVAWEIPLKVLHCGLICHSFSLLVEIVLLVIRSFLNSCAYILPNQKNYATDCISVNTITSDLSKISY